MCYAYLIIRGYDTYRRIRQVTVPRISLLVIYWKFLFTVNHIHKYYTVHITWYKNSRITWYLQVYRCTCYIFFVLLYVNMSWIHSLSPPSICIPHSAFCYCLCLPVPVCDVSLWWCVGTHSTAGKWNVTSISCYVSASLWRTLSSGSCRRRDNGTVAL